MGEQFRVCPFCDEYSFPPGWQADHDRVATLTAVCAELVEALTWAVSAAEHLALTTPKGVLRTGIETKTAECRAALSHALPFVGEK